jgi:translation initiation factor IF-1
VQMDNGHAIVAYTAGRMKRNRIRMIAGAQHICILRHFRLAHTFARSETRPRSANL